MVKDIEPGPEGSTPQWLENVKGTLFFTTQTDRRLWKSDGTRSGTVPVKRIKVDCCLAKFGSTLFFVGSHGTGRELWMSDGTRRGTVLVKDINPSGNSNPRDLTRAGGALFFTACDSSLAGSRSLWRSDGTGAGTSPIDVASTEGRCDHPPPSPSSSLCSRHSLAELTPVRGVLFFAFASDSIIECELWKSDGTEEGTVLVADINPTGSALPRHLTKVGGALYFSATDGVRGPELWKSDGTEEGTVLVKDVAPGPDAGALRWLTGVEGTLFFVADDNVSGLEVWMSDGTDAGTVLVEDINGGGEGSDPEHLYRAGSSLFFSAFLAETGRELWRASTPP